MIRSRGLCPITGRSSCGAKVKMQRAMDKNDRLHFLPCEIPFFSGKQIVCAVQTSSSVLSRLDLILFCAFLPFFVFLRV